MYFLEGEPSGASNDLAVKSLDLVHLNPELPSLVASSAWVPDLGLTFLRWFLSLNLRLVIFSYGLVAFSSVLWAQGVEDFVPPVTGDVLTVIEQADGKVLVGGSFSLHGDSVSSSIARFHRNGEIDTTFRVTRGGRVVALHAMPDGKTLVGGLFNSLGGVARANLGKLMPNGEVDSSFNATTDNIVMGLLPMEDGRIMVVGQFTILNSTRRHLVARILRDGKLDSTFDPGEWTGALHGNYANSVVVLADSSVIVAGDFRGPLSEDWDYLMRFDASGRRDVTFRARVDNPVISMRLQWDGALLLGGAFRSLNGHPQSFFGRFTPSGEVDETFRPDIGGPVISIGEYSDGRIPFVGPRGLEILPNPLPVAGAFPVGEPDPKPIPQALNRFSATLLGGIAQTPKPGHLVEYDGAKISWSLSGATPILERTLFQYTTNGNNWIDVGKGMRQVRTPPSPPEQVWSLDGAVVPTNASIRALGVSLGGTYNGSGSLIGVTAGPPITREQPTHATNVFRSQATFTAVIDGIAPVSYRWYKDGAPLSDDEHFSGTGTPTLTIDQVTIADEGGYFLWAYNGLGAISTLAAELTVIDPRIVQEPASIWVDRGSSNSFVVQAVGSQLRYQWYKKNEAIPAAVEPTLSFSGVSVSDSGDYSVVVYNDTRSVTSRVASLTVNILTTSASFRPAINREILAMAIQPDGKMLLGGAPGADGVAIQRLNPDGSIDADFGVRADQKVTSLLVRRDGRFLAGGAFRQVGGKARSFLVGLWPNGQIDDSFQVSTDGPVNAFLSEVSGDFIMAGGFAHVNTLPRGGMARILSENRLDESFTPVVSGSIFAMAQQADGRIVMSGNFTKVNEVDRPRLARITPGGALDEDFNPGANGSVFCLAIQPDGSICVGGSFSQLAGMSVQNLGRIRSDGSADTRFDPRFSQRVTALALRVNGRIVVGGDFQTVNRIGVAGLAQLNADGTLDQSFRTGSQFGVPCFMLHRDGSILASGSFVLPGEASRLTMVRLVWDRTVEPQFTVSGLRSSWRWLGPAPLVSQAHFLQLEPGSSVGNLLSGTLYHPFSEDLGYAEWEQPLTSDITRGTLGAVSFQRAGSQNSSSSPIIDYYGAPAMLSYFPGLAVTNDAGGTRRLGVEVSGTEPFGFMWLKDGIALPDFGRIDGLRTSTLTLKDLLAGDAGVYSVRVSNVFGMITQEIAQVQVFEPVIIHSPISRSADFGDRVSVEVVAKGTDLSFQWWKDAQPIPGATGSSLLLPAFSLVDEGSYLVTVSNRFGLATSQAAILSVNTAMADDAFGTDRSRSLAAVVLQPDGKILVGGSGVGTNGVSRPPLERFRTDGTLDPDFRFSANGLVQTVVVRADGSMLIGGSFTVVNGEPRQRVARLLADGSLDPHFVVPVGEDATDQVLAILARPDGGILLGGQFRTVGGVARTNLALVSSAGQLQAEFNTPFVGALGARVGCLAVQEDGQVLVGGSFGLVGELFRSNLARLRSDGVLDTSFSSNPDGEVRSIVVQPDGQILIGGLFRSVSSRGRNRLARLFPNGAADDSFAPEIRLINNLIVSSIALQTDGKIVFGGRFETVNGVSRTNLARLFGDGRVDPLFRPESLGRVNAIALDNRGGYLLACQTPRTTASAVSTLVRLRSSEVIQDALSCANGLLSWERSGRLPEIERVEMDVTTNGVSWLSLGSALRGSNAWKLASSPSLTGVVRARGWVSSGNPGSDAWFVEAYCRLAASDPPTLEGALAGGTIRLVFKGVKGQVVVVESARRLDLEHWTPLTTNIVAELPLILEGIDSSVEPWQFYRAKLWP
ncbi:MAG: hypothetical protein JNN07_27390 [Verrucomicrobiales bacterium]|nr:hypothetical protein [Verrucomicrobiales bacterium]